MYIRIDPTKSRGRLLFVMDKNEKLELLKSATPDCDTGQVYECTGNTFLDVHSYECPSTKISKYSHLYQVEEMNIPETALGATTLENYTGSVNGIDCQVLSALGYRCQAFINKGSDEYIQVVVYEQPLQSTLECASVKNAEVEVYYLEIESEFVVQRVRMLDR